MKIRSPFSGKVGKAISVALCSLIFFAICAALVVSLSALGRAAKEPSKNNGSAPFIPDEKKDDDEERGCGKDRACDDDKDKRACGDDEEAKRKAEEEAKAEEERKAQEAKEAEERELEEQARRARQDKTLQLLAQRQRMEHDIESFT